jgi:Tfp pilus assembly protein PilO
MEKVKQLVAFTALGVIAIGAGSWFLLISPKHSEAAGIRAQADQQVSTNATLQTQLAALKAQAKDLPAQQAALAKVAAKIPTDPGLPNLIRQLAIAADNAGVELVSLTPSQPTPVAAPITAAAAPAAVGAGAVPSAARAAGSATGSATGGLQSISLQVNVVGGYFQVEQFLDQLESLTRALKVSAFTLAPGANPLKPTAATSGAPSTLTTTITGTVYMAPARAATTTALVPATGK